MYVRKSYCKVLVIPVVFGLKFNSLDSHSKYIQISNFMKIRPVGAELFHADRRKDERTDRQRYDEANRRTCIKGDLE